MTSKTLDVALVQTDLAWEDCKANLKNIEQKIQGLSPTDLILLPEMFTTGFSTEPQPIAQKMDGPAISWMQDMAERCNSDIVGSMIIEDRERYYNRLAWVKPDASVLTYDKKHLFSFAGEDKKYSPGTDQLVVELNGWKIATFICYDLRFPIWSRNDKQRYDIAVYIASWPEKRSEHWKTLLRARAIENQAYVIGLNRVGEDGNNISYSGDSMIIDPLGEILFHSRFEEVVHLYSLQKDHLDTIRERFPFLEDADNYTLTV